MRKWRKYYIPGILSLVGIPILAFCFIPNPAKPYNVLRMYLPKEDVQNGDSNILPFSQQNFYKLIAGKKVKTIDFNDREEGNEDNLFTEKKRFFIREMENLKFSGDTSIVLKVTLYNSNTYGDFVWLIDEVTKYKIHQWMFADECFYFINAAKNGREIAVPNIML